MLVHSTTNLKHAKKLETFAYFLTKEAKKRKDKEARQAILADAASFKDIAKMLNKHNPAKAAKLMFSLDKVILDFVPLDVFHYLEDYYS